MSPTLVGILGCGCLLLLLMSSMPVAFAMALVGVAGFAVIVNPHAALSMMTSDLFDTISSNSLTVIPLFVLMGQLAFHGGVSRRLFRAAHVWIGHWRGGLAMATVGACTAFGAICGSGPATAATMAAVALPEMKRYGYSMDLACGAVAAGGSLGMLIPPSVVFIVYAILTEQSVGRLFMAGVLPGILIAVLFCLMIHMRCRGRAIAGARAVSSSWPEKLAALAGVAETAGLFLLVIGGMFAGFFTPTEAAAVGAGGTLVVIVLQRRLTRHGFIRAVQETIRTSCMVMIIVAGAVMFGRFLAVTRIPSDLAAWLAGLPLPGWMVMGMVILFYLVSGCFVDALALILLTIPVFYPVVIDLGYDPVWFGVMVVLVTQMGVISPPVGVNAYVVCGIERDVSLQTVFRGTMPFLGVLILAAVILMLFPGIALFLPGLLR